MPVPNLHTFSNDELISYIKKLEAENLELTQSKNILDGVNDAPLIIFTLNSEGVFTYSEGSGLKKLGLKPGEVVGMNIYDVYMDFPDILKQFEDALSGKTVRAVVKVANTYFDLIYQPLIDIATKRRNVMGVAIDITEQQLAVQERDRFFESTLALLCVANYDGYFTRINPAWGKTLGYTNEDLLSKPFLDFVHPEDLQATLTEMTNLKKGASTINFTNRYLCKDGTYKWLNWISVPYENAIYASAIDITEQKIKEAAMSSVLIELERSNLDLEQFAYASSHDLQEPLRKIKNYGELFVSKYGDGLDSDAKRYIDVMVRGAAKMQNLIDDLLQYSRINSRGKDLVSLETKKIIANVLDSLEYLINSSGAVIYLPDNMPVVEADESQLEQVFQNLISNSIKFKKDHNPEVRIKVEQQPPNWLFTVEDNGIGFDMEYADKIFTVFQRLHSQNEYQGTGIGLALCKKIIERHGGQIWAESKLGEGACFYFTLPMNNEALNLNY